MKITASDISVVIPSYNSLGTIGACLDALLAQEQAPREIIVVDSSTDGTFAYLVENYPEMRVRFFEKPTFPGPARNLGASIARGSVIAFIDSDCIARPDWVRRIAEGHDSGLLAVGGAVEVGNPGSRLAWAGHISEFREYLPVGKLRPMSHVPTCNVSYRRCLIERYGGFPNAYYPQEDLLFNHLLHRHGIPVWFDPALRVRHFYRTEVRQFLSHQHRIGRVTLSTMRRVDLPGSWIARSSRVAVIVAPLLAGVKFARTASALLRRCPAQVARWPSLVSLVFAGSLWWARGFAAGARQGLNGLRPSDDPEELIFSAFSPLGVAEGEVETNA